jgi:hypothetical protein
MGAIEQPPACLYLLAVFSRREEAVAWARRRAEEEWGAIGLESPCFEFDQFTKYYEKSMGNGLRKVFIGFEQLADPGLLAERKVQANRWEAEYAAMRTFTEPRPLNLDPGYLSEAKLVLATT